MNARRCAETTKKHVAVILAAAVTLTGCGQPREDEALRAQAAIQADCDGWNTRGFFENATDAVVQHCLDMGADVNARTGEEVTPLHLASQFGTPGQIKVLVDVGADIHALAYSDRRDSGWESGGGRYEFRSHWPPLLVAAVSGTPANVKALIDAGANVGRDELVWTVARGTPANLKALVHADVDIEGRDERGRTALHEAAGEWDSEAHRGHIEVLLEAGADIEARDRDGWTPLHLAAAWDGDIDRVEALVGAGANIEARGQAAGPRARRPRCIRRVVVWKPKSVGSVAKRREHRSPDDEGQTPLHVAARIPRPRGAASQRPRSVYCSRRERTSRRGMGADEHRCIWRPGLSIAVGSPTTSRSCSTQARALRERTRTDEPRWTWRLALRPMRRDAPTTF